MSDNKVFIEAAEMLGHKVVTMPDPYKRSDMLAHFFAYGKEDAFGNRMAHMIEAEYTQQLLLLAILERKGWGIEPLWHETDDNTAEGKPTTYYYHITDIMGNSVIDFSPEVDGWSMADLPRAACEAFVGKNREGGGNEDT